MAEDHGLRPAPEIEPGRVSVHRADLGQLLPRALLQALARRDTGVHEDVVCPDDERGQGPQPAEPLVQRAAQLRPDQVQRRRGAALDQ